MDDWLEKLLPEEREKLEKLTVKIEKVTDKAIMTLHFSHPLIRPANISAIDEEVLDIEIMPSFESDIENLGFNWTVVGFNTTSVDIKMDFYDPKLVSMGPHIDKVKVHFLEPAFFFSTKALPLAVEDETGFAKIPLLIYSESLEKIENLEAATTSISVLTLLLSILLAAILNFLWGMINALQLTFHLPMIGVATPKNMQLVFTMVLEQINLKFIPELLFFPYLNYTEEFDAEILDTPLCIQV